MLFLAVFCGFMAEWKLEHVIENQREKEYMHSIVEDIQVDVVQTENIINTIDLSSSRVDSLLFEISSGNIINNSALGYRLWRTSRGFNDFINNDRTIQQLKSSGSLRLIHIKEVSDKIMDYDHTVKKSYVSQENMNAFVLNNDIYSQFFDFIKLDASKNLNKSIPITSLGKTMLNEAYSNRLFWKQQLASLKKRLTDVNKEGKETISLIKSKYKFS